MKAVEDMTQEEKMEAYDKWQEYLTLIAQYDWAVEGLSKPAGCLLTRAAATDIRNNLVKLAADVRFH